MWRSASCTGDDPSTAEVALAVAHTEQAHGVGTLLLEHLASRARRAGVRRFVADVLAENGRVRQVLPTSACPCCGAPTTARCTSSSTSTRATGYLDALAAREERADVASLAAVLAPRSVVVVGAGRGSDSVGHAVLHNLVRVGFTGRLAAVNPHADAGVRRALPPLGDGAARAGRPGGAVRARGRGADGGRAVRAPGGAGTAGRHLRPVRRRGARRGPARRGPPPRHADGRAELPRHRQHRPRGAARRDLRRAGTRRIDRPGHPVRRGRDRGAGRSCAGWASACRRRCRRATSTTSAATTCCCGGTATSAPGSPCCTWSRSATRASSPASRAGSPSACRC